MKKYRSRIRVGMFTLAFGLASVSFGDWLRHYSEEVYVDLPGASSETLFVSLKQDRFPGFEETGHGCGGRNEYGGEFAVTGYRNSDSQNVSVYSVGYENKSGAKREISLRISESAGILEDSSRFGENSRARIRRIVLVRENDEGFMHEIITYDGGDALDVISTKSLKTAIEFEKWSQEHLDR